MKPLEVKYFVSFKDQPFQACSDRESAFALRDSLRSHLNDIITSLDDPSIDESQIGVCVVKMYKIG